ncbi:hypothetical protein CPLU01_03348 [Colletotrichum plurivorum]|uniref:Uncharacterized protein n=1 Tax=Colletotrichum plurivorum TaxID=2175906 RepID=A0A8H6KSQ7_9PEZI|nr:hypothetical protein CPLU01_03348 [Colletotrichum plurivorum]
MMASASASEYRGVSSKQVRRTTGPNTGEAAVGATATQQHSNGRVQLYRATEKRNQVVRRARMDARRTMGLAVLARGTECVSDGRNGQGVSGVGDAAPLRGNLVTDV